jgi:tetratricopeptide (TPR) repeat protein
MDPQMSALAQESHADVPISTIQDLQAYVAVSKARTSFAAGKYSDSLQQAQSAVQLKPNFIPALMGIGLSSGMLGQWNQAVSYIQTALNMDKSNPALKTDLKWAKNGQKIAAKGKQPNGKTPVWNLWTPASTDSKLPATSCS